MMGVCRVLNALWGRRQAASELLALWELDNARTLALTSIALADASISAWSGKYDEVQSRPQDVISGDNGQGIPISARIVLHSSVKWLQALYKESLPSFIK